MSRIYKAAIFCNFQKAYDLVSHTIAFTIYLLVPAVCLKNCWYSFVYPVSTMILPNS